MTVYVDDMRAPFGRMKMCHMVADSDAELHAMAARIGVARRWHQAPPARHRFFGAARGRGSVGDGPRAGAATSPEGRSRFGIPR